MPQPTFGLPLPPGDHEFVIYGTFGGALTYEVEVRIFATIEDFGDYAGGFGQRGNDGFALQVAEGPLDLTFQTNNGDGGCPGDTVIEVFSVDVETFESKSRNSPFQGWRLKGGPAATFLGGRRVVV